MTAGKTVRDRQALPGTGPTEEDLRHDVELTRRELGDTVAALVYKVDVRARVREAVQRRMALLHDAAGAAVGQTQELILSVRRHPVVAGSTLAVLSLLILLRIRHVTS